jgi:hypothetical protein
VNPWDEEVLATIQAKLNATYRGITLYLHTHHINLSSLVTQNLFFHPWLSRYYDSWMICDRREKSGSGCSNA